MTPAIKLATQNKYPYRVHEYEHDSRAASYGEKALDKLALPPPRVFKTLVVECNTGTLAVAVLPVRAKLSTKKFAQALKVKKVSMAKPNDVQRSTGYVLGGVSPLGQTKSLVTIIDTGAKNHDTIYVSAGKRGLEIELKPNDLANGCSATFASIVAEP